MCSDAAARCIEPWYVAESVDDGLIAFFRIYVEIGALIKEEDGGKMKDLVAHNPLQHPSFLLSRYGQLQQIGG